MFGSYCKKLLSSLFFFVIYFLFITTVAYVWVNIAMACEAKFGIEFGKTFNYCISAILTLFIELIAVYVIRIDNLKHKEVYKKSHSAETFMFKTDFIETIKSREHILHAAAFNTLMFFLLILLGMGTKLSTGLIIIISIALTIVSIILFGVISGLLWSIVHRKWLHSKK